MSQKSPEEFIATLTEQRKAGRRQILRILLEKPGISTPALLAAIKQSGLEISMTGLSVGLDEFRKNGIVDSQEDPDDNRRKLHKVEPVHRAQIAALLEKMGEDAFKTHDRANKKHPVIAQDYMLLPGDPKDMLPNVKPGQTMLYISPIPPDEALLRRMGGEDGFFQVEHHEKMPRHHKASVVVIDARNRKDDTVYNLIDQAAAGKTEVAAECPVMVIGDTGKSRTYKAAGAEGVFSADHTPAYAARGDIRDASILALRNQQPVMRFGNPTALSRFG